jgi:hypothetical protein
MPRFCIGQYIPPAYVITCVTLLLAIDKAPASAGFITLIRPIRTVAVSHAIPSMTHGGFHLFPGRTTASVARFPVGTQISFDSVPLL